MAVPPFVARYIGSLLTSTAQKDRLKNLHFRDAGHGYDSFGLHPSFVHFGLGITRFPYEKYFRVQSIGNEHLPAEGAAILAANHSGNLPFDGMMLWSDVLRHTEPPRVVRGIADHFVPALPFIGTTFARGGMVGGSRGNVRALLEAGELLMIFPEGTPGIIKPFRKRYQLQKFRVGHAELAIRHQVPVIPVGIIGAEEQLPSLFSSRRLGKLFGLEAVPIPLVPVPLPVRYYIYYGEPIYFPYDVVQADDPEIVQEAAIRVQNAVEDLIKKGLQDRKGIFR
jgi:1-acyl-sn-glycerol-3-phosphate acyltransferase